MKQDIKKAFNYSFGRDLYKFTKFGILFALILIFWLILLVL